MSTILHQHLTADANHTIHLVLPPEMGDEVEIIVIPRSASKGGMSQESQMMAQLMDESGFAKKILAVRKRIAGMTFESTPGTIYSAYFPFSDLSNTKKRPVPALSAKDEMTMYASHSLPRLQ